MFVILSTASSPNGNAVVGDGRGDDHHPEMKLKMLAWKYLQTANRKPRELDGSRRQTPTKIGREHNVAAMQTTAENHSIRSATTHTLSNSCAGFLLSQPSPTLSLTSVTNTERVS